MKKIMLIAFLGFMATTAFAQTNDQGNHSSNGSAKATKGKNKNFYCPKCFSPGVKADICPTCKLTRIAEGDYYCPKCYVYCPKVKCPNCGREGVKMTAH